MCISFVLNWARVQQVASECVVPFVFLCSRGECFEYLNIIIIIVSSNIVSPMVYTLFCFPFLLCVHSAGMYQ